MEPSWGLAQISVAIKMKIQMCNKRTTEENDLFAFPSEEIAMLYWFIEYKTLFLIMSIELVATAYVCTLLSFCPPSTNFL